MSDDCDRCDGDGTIHAAVGDLACPNCHDDVCQWCNTHFEDGEELGDSGLRVCRPCIRDMATYKEDACYSFYLAYELHDRVDDIDGLQREIRADIRAAFNRYGVELRDDDEGFDVRPPDGGSHE